MTCDKSTSKDIVINKVDHPRCIYLIKIKYCKIILQFKISFLFVYILGAIMPLLQNAQNYNKMCLNIF